MIKIGILFSVIVSTSLVANNHNSTTIKKTKKQDHTT